MGTTDDKLWDLLARWEEMHRRGQDVPADEFCRDCPELADRIDSLKRMDWLLKPVEDEDESADRPASFGEYTILETLGAGGMGQVFKALHRRMDRTVALKVLPIARVRNADALARFQQEVRSAARLHHPNIAAAYDAGEHDGSPFLVMEYVEGTDLFRHVQEHGPLPVEKAVDFVLQAARGLEYAHAQGVIHRDVKPGNLLLGVDGTVKVGDLGLACFRAAGTEQAVAGTVDFLAPEQTVEPTQADERSDVYSLGCTFFFLLTGKPLHEGKTVIQKVLAHRERAIPSLRRLRPDVPATLDAVFRRMVARKVEDRFQSMAEVVQALEQATTDRWAKKGAWASGAFFGLLLLVWVIWFTASGTKTDTPHDRNRTTKKNKERSSSEPPFQVEALKLDRNERTLRLNYLPVTDESIADLGALPQLDLLELVQTRVTDDGLKQLERFPTLTWLDLSGTFVTDKGLPSLQALNRLRILRLNRLDVTDEGVKHLVRLADLELLELYDASVTDAGLKSIGKMKKLNWLMLTGTRVSDAGLEELRGLDNLRRLYLERTSVTDAGAARLRAALPLCAIIR